MGGWPAHIRCSVNEVGPTAVLLAVGGEVDLASAPAMRSCVAPLLDALPAGGLLVVDLSEVEFLSAAGLSGLVGLARAGRDRGVAVSLGAVSERAGRILEVSGARTDIETAAAAVGLPVSSAG